MPVLRRSLKPDFDGSGCRAVIVGIDPSIPRVEKIWVHEDGNMILGSFVNRPWPGRTPVGEAITLFGLTKIRQFPIAARDAARAYACRLEIELDWQPLS
jgi:hypothetical protein